VGVNPAPIVRQAIAAMGVRHARRLLLTGERFDAAEAKRVGLVHETAPRETLEDAAGKIVEALLLGGPKALVETKALVMALSGALAGTEERKALAAQAANRRASPEAREGMTAFLEKRRPSWGSVP
jgi:methylglutaconyl-CoA hydratase